MAHPGIKCDVKISDSSVEDAVDTKLFSDISDNQFEELNHKSVSSKGLMMENVDAEAGILLRNHGEVLEDLSDNFQTYADTRLFGSDMYTEELPRSSDPLRKSKPGEHGVAEHIQPEADNYADELPGPSNQLCETMPEDENLSVHENVLDALDEHIQFNFDASLLGSDIYANELPGPSNSTENQNLPNIDKVPDVLCEQIQTDIYAEDLPGPSNPLRRRTFEDIVMLKELAAKRSRWDKKKVQIKTMEGEFSVTTWVPNPMDGEEGSDPDPDHITASSITETKTQANYLNERKVVCSYSGCNKIFKDTTSLRKHRLIHGPRVHICAVCDKAFVDNAKLKRHKLVHTGEQPYQCPVKGCGARFSLDFNLRTHLRTHTGEKPFVCSVDGCNHRFAQSSNLKAHMHIHAKAKKKAIKGLHCNDAKQRGTGSN